MKRLGAALMLALLAGCGADGEPVAPSMNANIGAGPGGVSGSAGVTVRKGPFSVGWGAGL
ncbi:MAG: hypothetical protein M5U35_16425 [Roseovarius sp.]|nr:hypothetical protein [Roseovarius sp.]